MRYLNKYETVLAAGWRFWSNIARILRKVSHANPRHLRHLMIVAKMFSNNRKFWSTNNPIYLSRALESYFKLRQQWLDGSSSKYQTKLEISGWADAKSLGEIRAVLKGYKIKRVFRPDVWYLKNRAVGMFAGFSFTADVADYSKVLRDLGAAVSGLDLSFSQAGTSMSQMASLKVGHVTTSRVESINISTIQVARDWFTAFSVNPREFTWLVEASVDKEVALEALKFYDRFGKFVFDPEVSRSIAIFNLIVGSLESSIHLPGWKLADVIEPAWIPDLEFDTDSTFSNLIGGKYFIQKDLTVSNGGILQTRGAFIDWDRAQHPSLDFVAGNWNKIIGTSANLGKCFIANAATGDTYESAIVLGSRADSNWFHFLIETLPRLLIVEDLVDKSIPVLISARVPETGVEALKVITKRKIVKVDTDVNTLVKRAYVPGPVIYHPDTQFMWGSEKLNIMNFKLLKALRDKVLNNVASGSATDKAFWPRFGRSRVASNSKQIQRLLSLRGFETQNVGSLKFEDQVRLIRNCRSLITEGGASMSNFLFLPEGSKILVLMSNQSKTYMMPKLLAAVSKSEVRIESGRSVGGNFFLPLSARLQASYRVSRKALSKAIGNYFL